MLMLLKLREGEAVFTIAFYIFAKYYVLQC